MSATHVWLRNCDLCVAERIAQARCSIGSPRFPHRKPKAQAGFGVKQFPSPIKRGVD
jgi:hypothetical protein